MPPPRFFFNLCNKRASILGSLGSRVYTVAVTWLLPCRSTTPCGGTGATTKARILVEKTANAKPRQCHPPLRTNGNPYEVLFPRARIWNSNDLAGLSGEHAPADWDTGVGLEAARLAEARKEEPSAKELYEKLIEAMASAPAGNSRSTSISRGMDALLDSKQLTNMTRYR